MGSYEYSGLIIGGIVVILLVRLGIGYWASKKVETTNDYVLAGRRLPIWMAGSFHHGNLVRRRDADGLQFRSL